MKSFLLHLSSAPWLCPCPLTSSLSFLCSCPPPTQAVFEGPQNSPELESPCIATSPSHVQILLLFLGLKHHEKDQLHVCTYMCVHLKLCNNVLSSQQAFTEHFSTRYTIMITFKVPKQVSGKRKNFGYFEEGEIAPEHSVFSFVCLTPSTESGL